MKRRSRKTRKPTAARIASTASAPAAPVTVSRQPLWRSSGFFDRYLDLRRWLDGRRRSIQQQRLSIGSAPTAARKKTP